VLVQEAVECPEVLLGQGHEILDRLLLVGELGIERLNRE
jgi:hypothetical protein